MISNKEIYKAKSKLRAAKSEGRRQWYYLTVKKLWASFREITPKNNCDF